MEQELNKKRSSRKKKLLISLAVIASIVAIGFGGYYYYINRPLSIEEMAEQYADKLMGCGGDSLKIEKVYEEIDVYFEDLSTEEQDKFNRSMEDYIKSLPSGTKTIEQTIKEIKRYYEEDLSPADMARFVEELGGLVIALEEAEIIRKQKEAIVGYINSLPEFFLSEEENAIFNEKLGEYAKGLKEGKQDEVKMDGGFAVLVDYYNGLSAEDKTLFVEVLGEYTK